MFRCKPKSATQNIFRVHLIGLVIIAILISCARRTDKEILKGKLLESVNEDDNPYLGLRVQAISVKPEQLGLAIAQDTTRVYGILMDWEIQGGIATIVAYSTGDASLYLSSGGGIIGGGQHKNVSKAAKEWVLLADRFINKQIATKTALPGAGYTGFFLLTNKGIEANYIETAKLEDASSPYAPLFQKANVVIGELKSVSEARE